MSYTRIPNTVISRDTNARTSEIKKINDKNPIEIEFNDYSKFFNQPESDENHSPLAENHKIKNLSSLFDISKLNLNVEEKAITPQKNPPVKGAPPSSTLGKIKNFLFSTFFKGSKK